MDRAKILIVEDDDLSRKSICLFLRKEFEVDSAVDAEEAIDKLTRTQFALIVTDIYLPRMDGFQLCSRIRAMENYQETPIVILSGLSDVDDKLMGFTLGANDFVTKPVDSRELRARIQVQLKRTSLDKSAVVEVGPIECNLTNQRASYWHQGSRVEIAATALEFRLLHYFLTHVEHLVTRNQLLDQVWGSSRHVNDRTVDAMVSKLRKKLGPYGSYLKAEHGAGYRFTHPSDTASKVA